LTVILFFTLGLCTNCPGGGCANPCPIGADLGFVYYLFFLFPVLTIFAIFVFILTGLGIRYKKRRGEK
jgi:hypothetical protein